MKVIIGCECSGAVRDAFIARGHDAISVDILPSMSNKGPHITADLRSLPLSFFKQFGLGLFYPPCTYLCSSGMHWCHHEPKKKNPGVLYGDERRKATEDALDFVRWILDLPIDKTGMENPASGCINTRIRRPDQVIHPNQFGSDASKGTGLWLKNLAPLKPTKIIPAKYACKCKGPRFDLELGKYGCANCNGESGPAHAVWGNQTHSGQNRLGPSETRAMDPGIAAAKAEQWGA